MARRPREEVCGAFYHVTARGNCGQTIYGDDQDRGRFLYLLDRVSRRHRWLCLAYCLMTNHFHLLVQIPDGGLSAGMQQLLSGYSRATNQRYGRRDHLFRQHFFSVRLKRQSHLLAASRYIVLNPVRAGLCDSPDRWRWSSHRACAGLEYGPAFLATGELLAIFAPKPDRARASYCDFVAAGIATTSDIVTKA